MKKRTMIILIISLIILLALLVLTNHLRDQILVRGALDRFYNFMNTSTSQVAETISTNSVTEAITTSSFYSF